MAATPAIATPLLTTHLPAAVARHLVPAAGAADPTARVTLAIALPMHDQPGLTALLRDIYNPASPNYRHYVSVAEFTARFGPSAADYATAVQFFESLFAARPSRSVSVRFLATGPPSVPSSAIRT